MYSKHRHCVANTVIVLQTPSLCCKQSHCIVNTVVVLYVLTPVVVDKKAFSMLMKVEINLAQDDVVTTD